MKNVDNIKTENITEKVQHYFFSFPREALGLNALSKRINASKTATKTAVSALIKEGILTKEKVGNAWRISANQKSRLMIMRKIPYNLQHIYETGIVDAVYSKVPNARAIILFGSYRWGSDNEKSDIDIAVEILGGGKIKIDILGIIRKLGFRKDVKVNMHIFSKNETDINLFANIANGIVLDGFLEVSHE